MVESGVMSWTRHLSSASSLHLWSGDGCIIAVVDFSAAADKSGEEGQTRRGVTDEENTIDVGYPNLESPGCDDLGCVAEGCGQDIRIVHHVILSTMP